VKQKIPSPHQNPDCPARSPALLQKYYSVNLKEACMTKWRGKCYVCTTEL